MVPLLLAWILMMVPKFGLSQMLTQEPVKALYPKILSTETIECDCVNINCDTVLWFRIIPQLSKVQFLAKCNNADRIYLGSNETRFKFNKRGSSFVMRITQVTEADAGIYSCILRDSRMNAEKFVPGTLLRPGETAPTLPPVTKKKVIPPPVCRCNKSSPRDGCSNQVLWPLAGITGALALGILCTLYYFSRLPRKCHHHFVKKRPMT
ncbi:uncharacterized protein cd8b [Cololabis saira]|uniref:uncharacterized protein cd8b n=1 Tax=Cololabis saira TaxID=129043 RepID=UPI002AD22AA9|nr:uncharacterized protein cd8b [Cololabis saira]